MSLEAWLANSTRFELIPALRDDCKLLKAALDGEDFGFEFNPSHPKWQNLVASLRVPGTREDEGFFGVELFESRLRFIADYIQQDTTFKPITFRENLSSILEKFVTAVEKAWGLGTSFNGLLERTSGEPAWMRSIETKSQGLAKAIKDYIRTDSHWDHPGVLMACDLLMKLMRIDRKPELEVRTKVMFAFEHRKEPNGILANLLIERLPNGSGLLIPHAAHCGLLWMPNNQGDSFSVGLQTAWHAARRYLKSKQSDWKVPHEDSGDLLSYDWRWRLDLSGLHETLPRLGWQNPIIPITGRSAETAIACALIAAAKHNPDSEGLGGSKDIDPLDPNIACTATIDLSRDDLPLGIVASIKTKTLLSEDTLAKERIYEVIVSDQQPAGTIPDNDERFKAIPVATLAQAYEQMVIYPRITRGVNRAIAADSKKDLDTYCTPYITPDIADVERWQQAALSNPEHYVIYPPEDAILSNKTLRELMVGHCKPIALGNRIFIEGESGLGKSMFLLRCQHEIASEIEAMRLPIRFGRTRLDDCALSQVDWSGLSSASLLELHQVNEYVQQYNNQLIDDRKTEIPKDKLLAWMEWLRVRGRIVLLLDALDQTHTEGIDQLGPAISSGRWHECPVIMTGRPKAKFDRALSMKGNVWKYLRIVPFDNLLWNKYLGTEQIEQYIDEAILSIPLLLKLLKDQIAGKDKQSIVEVFKGITRTELYDRAIDHLIERGQSNIQDDKPGLQNFARSKRIVKNQLSEIAWVMFESSGFVNQVTGDGYDAILTKLPHIDALSALEAIDITTSHQLLESTAKKDGLSFRHRSFLDYFLGMFLARTPADDVSKFLMPPLTDQEWEGVVERIHDSESGEKSGSGEESTVWSPQAWTNTFRFLLEKCSSKGENSKQSGLQETARDRDWVAKKLLQYGNPWAVCVSIERDGIRVDQGLESACRYLTRTLTLNQIFDSKGDESKGADQDPKDSPEIRSRAKEYLETTKIYENMLDRRFRDSGYLWHLRDLIGDEEFRKVYAKESGLARRLEELPGSGGPWNFLKSFCVISSRVYPEGVPAIMRKMRRGKAIQKILGIERERIQGELFQVSCLWIGPCKMADYPVTNILYELFCPSHRRKRTASRSQDDAPVQNVSLWEALEFCKWLSSITGTRYTLPKDYELESAMQDDLGWREKRANESTFCFVSRAEMVKRRAVLYREQTTNISKQKHIGILFAKDSVELASNSPVTERNIDAREYDFRPYWLVLQNKDWWDIEPRCIYPFLGSRAVFRVKSESGLIGRRILSSLDYLEYYIYSLRWKYIQYKSLMCSGRTGKFLDILVLTLPWLLLGLVAGFIAEWSESKFLQLWILNLVILVPLIIEFAEVLVSDELLESTWRGWVLGLFKPLLLWSTLSIVSFFSPFVMDQLLGMLRKWVG